MAWQFQHLGRQDQPVGGHHHHVRGKLRERIDGGAGFFGVFAVAAQRARLQYGREAVLQRVLLDRAGLQLHAAAGRAVGLAEHRHHRETGLMDGLERHAGEFRRAGKGNAQRLGWVCGLGHGALRHIKRHRPHQRPVT